MPFLINCWTFSNRQNFRGDRTEILKARTTRRLETVSAAIRNVENVRHHRRTFIISWWNGKLAIFYTEMESVSWDFSHRQMVTNVYLSLEITLPEGTEQYLYQIEQLSQLRTLQLIIGSADLVFHSLHSDQGGNFLPKLFEQLMQRLEMHKTRTTFCHTQSNTAIETMKKKHYKKC